MKISLNMIRRFNEWHKVPGDVMAIGVDDLIQKIGAQLGAVEEVIQLGDRYQNIVVARVVRCGKHPDADKLSVCHIDDGGVAKDVERDDQGLVQVVCGAPNVAADQLVAWLPPGSTVPSSLVTGEPFVLEARDLRGQKSNGMLASPKELALGDSHDGILVIDGDIKPGTDFAEYFNLKDDIVLDIENKMFTHRPDCFGFLGVARELAGIQQMPYKSPDWYELQPAAPEIDGQPLPLTVKNELPELVPRFSMIVMRDVQVGPSPLWLQIELAKLGQKTINNIVDYTNWFMLLSGQPLHAYDYDKLKALSDGQPTVVIRNPHAGEKLQLLNGKTIEPRAEAIMIATNKQAIGLGGVMGGSETEVGPDTKNIVLEAASFDMFNIRRTSMEHGLFTDAVTRFTKGQSPLQTTAVLVRIASEISRHAGGRIASALIDDNHLGQSMLGRGSVHPPVKLTADFVNTRLGLTLGAEEIKKLLENVEFAVKVDGDELTIAAPFWRTDIELREDVVEEVGRLYGYDHLPLELPRRDLTPAVKDPLLTLKSQLRARLAKAGANEVLTYSFVHGDLLNKVGQDPKRAFQIANALSPDLQYYRMSLVPSLLDKVHTNIKAGYDEFALFELGKTHGLDNGEDDGLPREFEFTAAVVAAADKLKHANAAYYQARRYLEAAVKPASLVFKPISDDMRQYAVVQPYNPDRSALVSLDDGTFLGIIGEFKPSVARALKLPKYCAGFEIDTTELQKTIGAVNYRPLSRFPKVTQDITLKVSAERTYQEVADCVQQACQDLVSQKIEASLSPLDIYQAESDTASKHITLRFTFVSHERTLTDAEVNKLLDTVAAAAKDKLGADRL